MEEPQNRLKAGRNPDGTFAPGFSGNPGGRPSGSLKDYVKNKLAEMSETEKEDFIKRVAPELVWRMAEGNPRQTSDEKVEIILPKPLLGGLSTYGEGKISKD